MACSNWTDFETCFIPANVQLEEDAASGFGACAHVASRVAAVPGQDLLLTKMLKHHDHELLLSLCHHKHIFLFSTTDQIES